jgi:hypothetical protein
LIDIIRGSGVSKTMLAIVCSRSEARDRFSGEIDGVWERWEVGGLGGMVCRALRSGAGLELQSWVSSLTAWR